MQLMTVTDENIPRVALYMEPKDNDARLGVELTLSMRRNNFLEKGNTYYAIDLETFQRQWENRWVAEEKALAEVADEIFDWLGAKDAGTE